MKRGFGRIMPSIKQLAAPVAASAWGGGGGGMARGYAEGGYTGNPGSWNPMGGGTIPFPSGLSSMDYLPLLQKWQTNPQSLSKVEFTNLLNGTDIIGRGSDPNV